MIKRSRTQAKARVQTVQYRINRQIRAREVRLIDQDGTNHGVVLTTVARDMAIAAELDLVEVAPNSKPPVCRIMDYSKFSYEQKKKAREAGKRQKQVEIKTIKLKVKTADFHRDISVKKARGWLEDGKKVKVSVRFYGRERDYPNLGRDQMVSIAEELSELATVEQPPTMEGWTMTMMLAPASTS